MNMMTYNGYHGRIAYDDEQQIFHGEIANIRHVVTFQGKTVAALKKAFKESLEDYLELCAESGIKPEKPLSGKFVVRVGPEVHRDVKLAAASTRKSINTWVTEIVSRAAEAEIHLMTSGFAASRPSPTVPDPSRRSNKDTLAAALNRESGSRRRTRQAG